MGMGYNEALPSMKPFEFVEAKELIEVGSRTLGVIAFGAYNAMGLIGTEKGGVAVVSEKPDKCIIATLDIPWNPTGRAAEHMRMVKFIKENRKKLAKSGKALVAELQSRGYGVR